MPVVNVIADILLVLVCGAFLVVSTLHMVDRIRFGDPASWPPPAPYDAVRKVGAMPFLGVDIGGDEITTVCAARATANGYIEIIGICQYTGDADSDGGECD